VEENPLVFIHFSVNIVQRDNEELLGAGWDKSVGVRWRIAVGVGRKRTKEREGKRVNGRR